MGAAVGNEPGDLTARRIEYRNARLQARRARTLALNSAVCIDVEDLCKRAAGCETAALTNITHKRLAVRALAAEGVTHDEIARWWGITTAAVVELLAHPLIDPEHKIEEIDADLRIAHGLVDDE
jgi:hypothetical protein